MSYTKIGLVVFAFGLSVAGATTTFSGANFKATAPVDGRPIVDNLGTPVAASWIFGRFTSLPDFQAASLDIGGFQSFSALGTDQDDTNAGGIFSGANSSYTVTTANLQHVGSAAFVLIGNAASIASSTDFIVLNLGVNLAAEVVGSGTLGFNLLTLTSSNHLGQQGVVTIERGRDVLVASHPNAALVGKTGLTFGPVPEPSVSLLSALAGFGLLIRRRR